MEENTVELNGEMQTDAAQPGARFNKILSRLIPIVCIGVLGNLAFSWYTTDRGKLFDWTQFSAGYLVVALVLALLPWGWHALRVGIWTRFFGMKIPPLHLLRIVVANDVGSAVAPAIIGGTPFKMGMLVQQGLQPGQAAMLALLGQLEEALFFAGLIPVSLVLTRPWKNPLWKRVGELLFEHRQGILLGLGILAVVVVLLWKTPQVRQFLKRRLRRSEQGQMLVADFRHAVKLVFAQGKKTFLLSMAAITGQWFCRLMVLPMVLLALGLEFDFLHLFFLQWMVFVSMLVVPTPGGTGGAEAAFYLVYHALIPHAAIGPAMAGWRLLTYYGILLIGVGILFTTVRRKAG